MDIRLKTPERMKNDPKIRTEKLLYRVRYISNITGGYISYDYPDDRLLKPTLYKSIQENQGVYSYYIKEVKWYITKEHVEEWI